jgi:hypothetical protein
MQRRDILRRGSAGLVTTVGVGLAGCSGDETEPTGSASGTGGAGGNGPSPVLSLSADMGVTTDSDGQVETWADQSGNGYDFSPPRAEARPGLTQNAAGGNPALTFDGDGQFLLREDTLGIPDDSARTFVVVSKLDDIDVRAHFFFQGTLNASGADSNFYGVEANTYNTVGERFGVYLVSVANDSERETDSNYHIHTIRTESFPTLEEIRDTTTYYVDGAETSFSHTGGGAFNSPFEADSTAIGANTKEDPSGTHTGEIAAVRVYDSALSSSERESVESNLADTYGISIS